MTKKHKNGYSYSVGIRLEADAEPVDWFSLSVEQQQNCKRQMSRNMSSVASDYITSHKDEYAALESLPTKQISQIYQ